MKESNDQSLCRFISTLSESGGRRMRRRIWDAVVNSIHAGNQLRHIRAAHKKPHLDQKKIFPVSFPSRCHILNMATSHVMTPKSNKAFFSRWIEILLWVVPCVLLAGFFAYVSSGKSVSVGQFDLRRRDDGLWSYRNGRAASFSANGAHFQSGETYCIGPFRITRWSREWEIE